MVPALKCVQAQQTVRWVMYAAGNRFSNAVAILLLPNSRFVYVEVGGMDRGHSQYCQMFFGTAAASCLTPANQILLCRTRYCAIIRSTTNPHDRYGLTIWLEGEKAGASRFFRIWSLGNAGIA